MASIEYLTQCVAQIFVDDGCLSKLQYLVGHSEIAVQVTLGVVYAHCRGGSDAMPNKIALQAADVVAAQGENGSEKFIFVNNTFIEVQANAV